MVGEIKNAVAKVWLHDPAIDWIFVDGAEHCADLFLLTPRMKFFNGIFFLKIAAGQPGFLCSCGNFFPTTSRSQQDSSYSTLHPPSEKGLFPLNKVMGRREDDKTIRIGFPFGVWFSPFIQKKIRQLKMWNLLWIDLVGWLKSGGDFFLQPLNRPWFLTGKNPGGVTVTNRLPEALGCPCCCGSTRRGDGFFWPPGSWFWALKWLEYIYWWLVVVPSSFCFSTRWREMKILN